MSRFHIYKLFSIHFNLKKTCQDILYTMDNLEIRGTLGRNSYSRCEAVVVILIVIAELFLLRCIYWIVDIYAQTKQQVFEVYFVVCRIKKNCAIF